MKIVQWLSVFCLLILSTLVSGQDFYSHRMPVEAISSYEGLPSCFVDGVNVITGEYIFGEQDINLNTPAPLDLKRHVSSLLIGKQPIFDMWAHNHECTLEPLMRTIEANYHCVHFIVGERNGGCTQFVKRKYKHGDPPWEAPKVREEMYKHGLSNTGRGAICGRNAIENYTFQELSKDNIVVTTSDGTVRHYGLGKRYNGDEWRVLYKECMPDGHVLQYTYDAQPGVWGTGRSLQLSKIPNVSEVKLTNPKGSKVYGWIRFKLDQNTHTTEISSSEGHQITYHRRLVSRKWAHLCDRVLDKVTTNFGIPTTYQYEWKYAHAPMNFANHLVKWNRPDGRYLQLTYYEDGIQFARTGRIKKLSSPAGNNSAPVTTRTFFYDYVRPNEGSNRWSEPEEGSTTVLDAYNNKTIYKYNKNKLLEEIATCFKDDLYKKEIFSWTTIDSKTPGRLLSTHLEDNNKNVVKKISYTYDAAGNVLEKRLEGNICGAGGKDVLVEKAAYCKGTNLLASQEFASGITITYEYLQDTDLITAKLYKDKAQIVKRLFYEYDADNLLQAEIVDDGKGALKDDLSGVTQRRIVRYSRKQTAPALGMPERIDELYFDAKAKKEVLLRSLKKSYNARGLVAREEQLDSKGNVINYTAFEYNTLGLPTCLTTPQGVTDMRYDANGNLLSKTDPEGNRTEYVYDFCNRLTAEKQIDKDTGTTLTKQYEYDFMGNVTAAIDWYGNTTKYAYDPLGRKIKEILPPVLDVNGKVKSYEKCYSYDILGNLVKEVIEGEKGIEKSYTILGKPARVSYPDGTVERFEYTLWGVLKSKTERRDNRVVYTHDIFDRVVKQCTYSPSNVLLDTVSYVYDAFNLLETKDNGGTATRYKYDAVGRKIEESVYSANGERTTWKAWEYDDFDRVVGEYHYADGSGSATITRTRYDNRGLAIEKKVQNHLGELLEHTMTAYNCQGKIKEEKTVVAGMWAKKSYNYNMQGDLTRSIDPLGQTTTYYYNRLTKNSLGVKALKKSVVDPLKREEISTYDALGRVESVAHKNGSGALFKQVEYLYDAHGNKVQELHQVISQENTLSTHCIRYTYDELDRPLSITRAYGTPDATTMRKVYKGEQIVMIVKPDGNSLCYEYHPFGMVARFYATDGSVDYRYHYDSAHDLIEVLDQPAGKSLVRSYDGAHRLVNEVQLNGLAVRRSLDLQGKTSEIQLPSGGSIKWHYRGPRIESVVRKDAAGLELYSQNGFVFAVGGQLLEAPWALSRAKTSYSYDLLGRALQSISENSSGGQLYKFALQFDAVGNITDMDIEDAIGPRRQHHRHNDMDQLVEEKRDALSKSGAASVHNYTFDSIHNRLAKDDLKYTVDALNQLKSVGENSYSYDKNGNCTSRKIEGKQVNFLYDGLNRLVEAVWPNEKKILFAYDPFGLLMERSQLRFNSKENRFVLEKTEQYLYDGQRQIGVYNTAGKLQALRVLAQPERAELASAAVFELGGALYCSVHDCQGNIAALYDARSGNIVETYRYTAFGEEQCFNGSGKEIGASQLRNPWHFSSKRWDSDLQLVDFGKRFYDPAVGRWLTPDPLGGLDACNLYAYAMNRPLTTYDAYGLLSEAHPVHFVNNFINHYNIALNSSPLPVSGARYIAPEHVEFASYFNVGRNTFPDREISYINGMCSMHHKAKLQGEYISELGRGAEVSVLHNPTHGLIPDLGCCILERLGWDSEPVRLLHELWDKKFDKMSENGRILHFCYSEGAIITKNALMGYFEEKRNRIEVVAIAPGAIIPPEVCGSVRHYVSTNDIVHRTDPSGLRKYSDTVVELKPPPEVKGFDHDLMSPTYRKMIDFHIKEFINRK